MWLGTNATDELTSRSRFALSPLFCKLELEDTMIGRKLVGAGPTKVVVLSDWLLATSSWDGTHVYLKESALTWAFADLRGYGWSRNQAGKYTVEEGAHDVLELADSLEWDRFYVVGHSMSCLVALHLAQRWPERIARVVAITPPPPAGLSYNDTTFAALQAVAGADDARRTTALRAILGDRLCDGWIRHVLDRWRAESDESAVAGYVAMFGRCGLPDTSTVVAARVLAITGEEDAEIMRSASVSRLLAPLCERLRVIPLADCGHYPMLEAPPRLVTALEQFLTSAA